MSYRYAGTSFKLIRDLVTPCCDCEKHSFRVQCHIVPLFVCRVFNMSQSPRSIEHSGVGFQTLAGLPRSSERAAQARAQLTINMTMPSNSQQDIRMDTPRPEDPVLHYESRCKVKFGKSRAGSGHHVKHLMSFIGHVVARLAKGLSIIHHIELN